MKIIAFYLPQYHPIPENDEWWGKGFTEWTNVSKARPLFNGHYQPHIPADLGFYDLRLPEVRIEQSQLAKEYGIDAFCYYHYWFNGKMLLERPFNEVLASPQIDHEFCLCWANENWTRRWDGMEHEMLIKQDYSDYNPAEHIKWLSSAFKDDRYIKVHGKPLFLIYRASDIPNLSDVIKVWRKEIKKYGFDDIYACCANNSQNILSKDKIIEIGFDAIYDFSPNLRNFSEMLSLSTIPGLNIYSYKKMVEMEISKPAEVGFPVFPCIFPSWDNSPRRKHKATIIQNEDVNLYKNWLSNAIGRVTSYSKDEQIVFINAWNEWGEGCHLEPDLKHGRKFLEATKSVLQGEQIQNSGGFSSLPDTLEYSPVKKIMFDESRPIYIWGAGSYGQRVLELLKKSNVKVTGFIDSDNNKNGTLINEISVFLPEYVLNKRLEGENPYIIVASMYYDEIIPVLQYFSFENQTDYAVNIIHMTIKKKETKAGKFILIENGHMCNICGFGKFETRESDCGINEEICEKCLSTPKERMVIEVLAEEIGAIGLPLSDWQSHEELRLLNVNFLQANSFFLDLAFLTQHLTKKEILARNIDKRSCQFALMEVDDFDIDKSVLSRIVETLDIEGKLILILKNENHRDFVEQFLCQQGFEIYYVKRDYKKYKTGSNLVLICENR